jgi:hypothetical protein
MNIAVRFPQDDPWSKDDNRANIRRLATLETERAELALKGEKQQTQLREAIVTWDATIRRLNDVLVETIVHERNTYSNAHPQDDTDEIMALRMHLCRQAAQPYLPLRSASLRGEPNA